MISNGHEETQQIALEFALSLNKPTIITLSGELGAGKTSFIQGLAKGIGLPWRILSPTFVFVRSYKVENKPFKIFHHVDLFRCENLQAAKSIGIDEILTDDEALVAIEWPEIIEEILPKEVVKIVFKKISENSREIIIL